MSRYDNAHTLELYHSSAVVSVDASGISKAPGSDDELERELLAQVVVCMRNYCRKEPESQSGMVLWEVPAAEAVGKAIRCRKFLE